MRPPTQAAIGRRASGFTLVEVMLATAILAVLVVMFAGMVSQTSKLWQRTTGKVEQFRSARNAFENMSTRLSQATLNTYWDYLDASGQALTPANASTFVPARYARQSELRFISGQAKTVLTTKTGVTRLTHCVFFQAPLGYTTEPASGSATAQKYRNYDNLLCSCGYYLEFGDDSAFRPPFITTAIAPFRNRHRLMEFLPPAEKNNIYQYTSPPTGVNTYNKKTWYQPLVDAVPAANTPANYHPIAENIVALIITPRLSQEDELDFKGGTSSDDSPLAPAYDYDSAPGAATDNRYSDSRLNPTNQLPPILQVTMVAIDEASAIRLNFDKNSADVFGVSSKFAKGSDYSKDLLQSGGTDSLESTLIAKGVNYRIFNTNVTIRAAKWSREQIK